MDNSRPPHNGHQAREFSVTADEVTCQQFVELVTDYFEGALEPHTLSQVEEHLVMCDWCVTYVEQMQATIASLRELGEPSAPEPTDSVLAALRAKRGRSMIAYKFLRAGRVGPFSALPVARAGRMGACRAGSGRVPARHSCLPAQRPPVVAR